uniref:Uncharacterized protein n=1 Tax=Arundo donax TaxID=35708 RepID=A0A0A8YC19_ARUDO
MAFGSRRGTTVEEGLIVTAGDARGYFDKFLVVVSGNQCLGCFLQLCHSVLGHPF